MIFLNISYFFSTENYDFHLLFVPLRLKNKKN